jgi:hypothetical protein
MTTEELLLSLTDEILCTLYREWSEDHYAAGWTRGGEREFVDYALDRFRSGLPKKELEPYEAASIAEIRRLLAEKAKR